MFFAGSGALRGHGCELDNIFWIKDGHGQQHRRLWTWTHIHFLRKYNYGRELIGRGQKYQELGRTWTARIQFMQTTV